jgi:hypothetical protein
MNQETRTLHSRYPRAEAERFVSSLSLKEKARFFILIEPGLGYMIAPLRKRCPGVKIIALHAGISGISKEAEKADAEWFPGAVPVRDFLEREIPNSAADGIQILEWRPALAVFGKAYLSLIEETAEFVRHADAEARTIKAFGPGWFANFFKNLRLVRKLACLDPVSEPILVTGAGPGLEEAIPLISRERFIMAVSSSAAALEAAGLIPQMVVAADGGGWAKFHLYSCFRGALNKAPVCLAAALTAALPSQCGTLPLLLLSDGSRWQTLNLNEQKLPHIPQPQRRTVAATALDLAFALGNGDTFIAGMDLANRDIRTHARPYCFDRFLEEKERRLNPVYSQAYRRSSLLKAGGAYGIYASWFKKQLALYPRQIRTLGKNNPLFDSAANAGPAPNKKADGTATRFKTITLNNDGSLSQKAYAILERTLEDPCQEELSKTLSQELGALLFHGEELHSKNELIEAVRTLAGFSRSPEQKHG